MRRFVYLTLIALGAAGMATASVAPSDSNNCGSSCEMKCCSGTCDMPCCK